ncbi:MAG: hypothetical protein WBB30_06515 [Solirubrobacterales bacterium]
MRSRAGSSLLGVGAIILAAGLVGAGCGGDDESALTGESAAPDAAAFPDPAGRTLEQIAADEGVESDLVVAPAGQVFQKGQNRLGFGVFTVERVAVADAEIAIYAAPPNKPAVGPFPASVESLDVGAAFRSRSTAADPDAAKVVYGSDVDFDGKGEWRLLALVKQPDGSFTYTAAPSAVVGRFPKVPQPGEKAPVIETLTGDDVGGDLVKIDTRQPPSTMHEDNFAEVVGKEPIVLLFATPALCSSRVCGPVVDIAEEVKSERGDEAAFIMQEIYKDNMVDKGLREQVEAYNLPSEPWLFVIDTDGKISTAVEGAFSKGELEAALDQVTAG